MISEDFLKILTKKSSRILKILLKRILQYPYQNTNVTKILGRFAAGTNKGGFNPRISVDVILKMEKF